MLNLLGVNNYHYHRGGSDAMYFAHNALFADTQQWQAAYFSMHHAQNLPSHWDRYFISNIDYGEDYSLLEKLKLGAKIIYSKEAQKQLSTLLSDHLIDVAHLHCIYHHISPSILPLLKERDIPVVMTAHDLKLACPAYKMMNSGGICEQCKSGQYHRVLSNKCLYGSAALSGLIMVESYVHKWMSLYKDNLDKVVTPSKFYQRKLIEWGWPAEQLVHINNFIDDSAFSYPNQPGDYFLFFGRLAPEKGVKTLIDAAVEAKVKLKIAGTGPMEDELKAYLAQRDHQVEFLGFQSGEVLQAHVRGAKAVVLPSEWYENQPMSILEAYAMGKIVIGADIAGIPEMIVEGETGYQFASGDKTQLVEQLLKVENLSTQTLEQMGQQCREYVIEHHSPDQYLDQMTALYRGLGVKC